MLIIEIYMMTLRKLCFSVEQIVAPAKATAYCFFLTGINNMVHVSNGGNFRRNMFVFDIVIVEFLSM
jgi:hypothetical protein